VLQGIEARAPEAARAAMAAHINTVADTFEALARTKPGLFAP
jgi:DNA-binding GntR family transcriptional regulator